MDLPTLRGDGLRAAVLAALRLRAELGFAIAATGAARRLAILLARASPRRCRWRSRRARGIGFSSARLWVLPGLAVLPSSVDRRSLGARRGMLVMTPVLAVGGLMISSAGNVIEARHRQVWQSAAARSEALLERREGRSKLLVVRDLNVWLRHGAGAVRRRTSRSPRARSSPCSAPTAPASRPCSRRSPASSRPTSGRSCSTVATSPTPRPNEVAARGRGPDARRCRRVPVAHRRREPAGRRVARRSLPNAERRRRPRCSSCSPCSPTADEVAANLSGGQQQMLALAMALLSPAHAADHRRAERSASRRCGRAARSSWCADRAAGRR
jgi:hypothetical protein